MLQNKLMINDLKTEFIAIVSPQQEGNLTIPGICAGDSPIPPTNQVRNLGVVSDKHLNMRASTIARISTCVTSAGSQCALPGGDAETQPCLHNISVDCCNALLHGINQSLANRLQRILNSAAKILTLTPKVARMTPVRRELHWLPASARVDYKILVLTYQALHGFAPQHLRSLLQWYQPGHALRSWHSSLLCVPRQDSGHTETGPFPTQHPFCGTCYPQSLAGHHPWLRSRPELIHFYLINLTHRTLYRKTILPYAGSAFEWTRDMTP